MTLADHLDAARAVRFVGRAAERALFRDALTAEAPAFRVLLVHGPGGIGKTALLEEFERMAESEGATVRRFDARELRPAPGALPAPPSPEAFLRALGRTAAALPAPARRALGAGDGPASTAVEPDPLEEGPAAAPASPPSDEPARRGARRVLLVDGYEALGELDEWVRTHFLPQAPGELLVVLAGRTAPDAAWRADAGWRALAREAPLRNLLPDEARAVLDGRGVDPARHAAVLAFTRGHPLALALAAEACLQNPEAPFDPGAAPDVVEALLHRFVEDVPSPAHRAALEACAVTRTTTESLLAALLDVPDAYPLFAWLRELSFVAANPEGLAPHELARRVLAGELRWRHPDRFDALHARARAHFTRRLQAAATPDDARRVLADYAFLYRQHPLAGPLLDQLLDQLDAGGHAGVPVPTPYRPSDREALLAMTERHEGAASAALLARWLDRRPDGPGESPFEVEVFRERDDQPCGYLALLAVERTTAADRAADPAVEAACAYVGAHAPLREGDRALLFRFWMDAEGHQGLSPVQSAVFARTVWHYLATPGLALSLLPCAAPHGWAPILAFADVRRVADADFTIGEGANARRFEQFGHDWRAVPPAAWLDALATRGPVESEALNEALPEPALVVLSEPDFAAAVRDALKAYASPHRLRGNPLLRSRLVAARAGAESDEPERITALRELLGEAARTLEGGPREERLLNALEATYLRPAPSQALAAERLDLPFSTYRRYLDRGVRRVVETLWLRELEP